MMYAWCRGRVGAVLPGQNIQCFSEINIDQQLTQSLRSTARNSDLLILWELIFARVSVKAVFVIASGPLDSGGVQTAVTSWR
jgi:hypothetical protein